MAINIPVRDVAGAQHLRCLVRGPVKPDDSTNIVDLVMDVYTGWLTFTYQAGLPHENVISFVPLGTGTGTSQNIQGYVGGASAIVSASISSFADDPDLAAVDRATVKLVTKDFAGLLPAQVLVLDASIAVGEGKLHRIAYQVTVLVTAKEPPRALAELNDTRLSIDKATTP
jgi:hypothetical protein